MPHCKKFHDMNCDFECLSEHRIASCGTVGENDGRGTFKGIDYLRKKELNKDLSFTLEERQMLGIHGLLPAVVKTEEEQITHASMLVDRLKRNLDKYMYLQSLVERNQRLFFQLIASNIEKFLTLIHTPTLSEVCLKFSMIYDEPKGVFITLKDKCRIYDVLGNWPTRDVRVIVVTDGERVLELGDQGANGMALSIANTILYTALAGIRSQHCLPITLDCGTNCRRLILDALYIGLRRERICGQCYDELIDEFMQAVVRRFGQNCIVHFEGFSSENSHRLLAKYHKDFCMFNNDIEVTGSIILSGILAALRATGQPLKEQVILLHGVGEASIGINYLFHYALKRLCEDDDKFKQHIWLYNSEGLIAARRPKNEEMINSKTPFVGVPEVVETFLEAVSFVRPTVLIGISAVAGVFSKSILEKMAQINKRPVILVLSNDAARVECTAQMAYNHTAGSCFYASGCKFPLVQFKRYQYHTSQINNFAIFSGVTLGVLCAGMCQIPLELFYIAADTLADLVTSEDLALGRLYPARSKLFCCSIQIAKWVMEYAYRFNLATIQPEPENKIEFIKSQMFNLHYPKLLPEYYYENC